MSQKKLEVLCKWLREEKGVTEIDIMELAEYAPEYEEWLEEQKKVWATTSVECDLCGHQWQAVHHIDSDRLECPNCEKMVMYK